MTFTGGSASFVSGEVRHASKLPLIAGLVALLAGVALIPLAFLLENRAIFVLGYLATPVLTLLAVAWDALLQRKGSRDPWFSVNKKLSAILRATAVIAFIPAVIHIWQIANWLGEQAVQNGWFA